MKIVQLIPHLPPVASGISDYALLLAEYMRLNRGISTDFVTYELEFERKYKKSEVLPLVKNFSVEILSNHDPNSFLSIIPEDISGLIVHYNFRYPFANAENNPAWMVKMLQSAKKKYNFKLLIVLHELVTTFKYKKYYLPAPRQLLIAFKVFNMSDGVIVNSRKLYNRTKIIATSPLFYYPNFSTIGEPDLLPPIKDRQPIMMIFGTQRYTLYREFGETLLKICKILKIEKIYDVGGDVRRAITKFQEITNDEIPVIEHGVLPKETISKLMLECKFGYLNYSKFLGELGKSTIFAAYSSHGLVPILTSDNFSQSDGLKNGHHYLTSDRNLNNLTIGEFQKIADNAHHWYQSHSFSKISKFYISFFS